MPEVTPDINQGVNTSPLPNPPELSKDVNQSKKTLIVGASLVAAMLILVGATFYSLRSGSSSLGGSSTSPQPVAQSSVSDRPLDNSINQVSGDFSKIDAEVDGVNSGLNDKAANLNY